MCSVKTTPNSMEAMLEKLREIVPAENFKIEPESSEKELIELEKTYQVNTSDFLEKKCLIDHIPMEVQESWINKVDTFFLFNGSIGNLNTFK